MTNLIRGNFQDHPFHLVSPSPWPLYTSISLFVLTVNAGLSMHLFYNSYILFYVGLIIVTSSMFLWFKDIIAEGSYLGNHTLAVQKGLNLGVILFIVSEALFFMAIFWAFFHKIPLWVGAKLRGTPKALITKLLLEMAIVASLMIEGIVTSLKILNLRQGMGNRGSKSDKHTFVKEQRADGSSICLKYRKVCSTNQRNLVFILPLTGISRTKRGINTIASNKYLNSSIFQKSICSTKFYNLCLKSS